MNKVKRRQEEFIRERSLAKTNTHKKKPQPSLRMKAALVGGQICNRRQNEKRKKRSQTEKKGNKVTSGVQ